MPVSSVEHAVRVSFHVHVGEYHREVDISLPTSARLAEALPEILDLAQAPEISRPWRISTSAGTLIEQTIPIYRCPIEQGSVVIASPLEPLDAPTVRDSAQMLAELTSEGSGARGASELFTALGLIELMLLIHEVLPMPAALAGAAICALTLAVWKRDKRNSCVLALLALGFASAAPTSLLSPHPWAFAAGCAAGLTVLICLSALQALSLRWISAAATLLFLMAVATIAYALGPPTAAPASTLLAIIGIIIAYPSLATAIAGLKVAVLPAAGDDYSIADNTQPDVAERSALAIKASEGFTLAVALATIPSTLALIILGDSWAQWACLLFSAVVLIQGSRHPHPVHSWSMFSAAAAAVTGVLAIPAWQEHPHPAQLLLAGALMAGCITAVLWAPRLPELEPTTVIWLERAEMTAHIVAIPLLLQVAGLFAMIRGL